MFKREVRHRRPAVCIVRHNSYGTLTQRNAETLTQAGFDVTVIQLRRPGEPPLERVKDVEIHRLPVSHRRGSSLRYAWEYLAFFLLAFLKISVLHAQKNFRIIEAHNIPDIIVFTAIIPKLTGATLVYYNCDNMPEMLAYKKKLAMGHPAVRLFGMVQRICATFADRVIVPTLATGRALQSRGIPARKIQVVLNGGDDTIFSDWSTRRVAAPTHSFEIVSHGTIMHQYGIQLLIDVLPELIEKIPDVRVHIIGEGEYRGILEEQARQRGVADRIRFTGWMPMEELPAHLYQAAVGYVGVLYDLALSNKLLEYAALRIPSVVSRWSSHQDYFPDESAFYFDQQQPEQLVAAIMAIRHDPAGAQQRAERASTLYRTQYCWAAQRGAYLRMYTEITGLHNLQPAALEFVPTSKS